MVQAITEVLRNLYEADETAWLETMADLIKQGRLHDLDYSHLGEYLTDMARRDRREVKSRLVSLLADVLKWTHQAKKRTKSWRKTILNQQMELADLTGKGVLHGHALAVLAEAYANAVKLAAAETGLPAKNFPEKCPYKLDELLAETLVED